MYIYIHMYIDIPSLKPCYFQGGYTAHECRIYDSSQAQRPRLSLEAETRGQDLEEISLGFLAPFRWKNWKKDDIKVHDTSKETLSTKEVGTW